MADLQNAFPKLNSEFVDENRQISIPWYRFLVSLWNRTGGSSGSISAILDNINNTPGAILYRGSAEWKGLGPGVAGQALYTGGAGAAPAWHDTVSQVNTGVGLKGGPITTTGTISFADAGAGTLLGNATGGAAPSLPLSPSVVKGLLDYVEVGDAAGGDLTGTYPDPSLGNNVVSNAKLAKVPALTMKGNANGVIADPSDLTVAQVLSMLGLATGPGEPNFLACLTASQNVTSGANTKVAFDGVLFNVGGYYDGVTNFRFTPLVPGTYRVKSSLLGFGVAGAPFYVVIQKNGAAYAQTSTFPSGVASAEVSALVQMNGTTDFLEIFAELDAAGAPSLYGSGTATIYSWFEAYRVGG